MKRPSAIRIVLVVLALLAMVAGCATRPAPDIRGRWKPVNHYAETPQAIPLYESYIFQASPMDGTLKNMLTRWVKDSRMTLSYLHQSDFTLYELVAQIHTSSLEQAVSQLNDAYAGQQVAIVVEGRQVVVRAAGGGLSGQDPGEGDSTAAP